MTHENNRISAEYTHSFMDGDKELKIEIKCYEKPVKSSEMIQLFTEALVKDGEDILAEYYFPSFLDEEDAKQAFTGIKDNWAKLKPKPNTPPKPSLN